MSRERHRALALAEVILAAAVVIGHNVYHIVPNEVLVLLVVGAISLALRRQSLRSIGFRSPSSWTQTILIALAAAVALQLISTYITESLIARSHISDRICRSSAILSAIPALRLGGW